MPTEGPARPIPACTPEQTVDTFLPATSVTTKVLFALDCKEIMLQTGDLQ